MYTIVASFKRGNQTRTATWPLWHAALTDYTSVFTFLLSCSRLRVFAVGVYWTPSCSTNCRFPAYTVWVKKIPPTVFWIFSQTAGNF